jgi:threonyl-tRNA synthetase
MGILIEHYAGAFPLWLSPEQVRILPISDKTSEYAQGLVEKLKAADIRCSADATSEKIGAKVAKAHADRVSYMLVVGPKEAEEGVVSVRMRGTKEMKIVTIDEFISIAKQKIDDKTIDLGF